MSNSKFYKERFLSKSTKNKIEYMNTKLNHVNCMQLGTIPYRWQFLPNDHAFRK